MSSTAITEGMPAISTADDTPAVRADGTETAAANGTLTGDTNCVDGNNHGSTVDGVGILEEYVKNLAVYNPFWDKSFSERIDSKTISNEEVVNLSNEYARRIVLNAKNAEHLVECGSYNSNCDSTLLDSVDKGSVIADTKLLQECHARMDTRHCPVKLEVNSLYGRHLVSSRKIQAGEAVIVERPLVIAPLDKSTCVSCLGKTDSNKCKKCGFLLCGPQCQTPEHEKECALLQKIGLCNLQEMSRCHEIDKMQAHLDKLSHEKRVMAEEILQRAKTVSLQTWKEEIKKHYSVVAALRTLLASRVSKVAYIVLALQAHHIKGSRQYVRNQKRIVDVITKQIQVIDDEDLVHHIAGVWDTNSFEVQHTNGKVQGLYPGAALLTHSCSASLQQWFAGDGVMVLRAMEDIPAGEVLTICYTEPLWPTKIRIDHLRFTKYFDCTCPRCQDPTECGTYMGSVLCQECRVPMAYDHPLDLASPCRCKQCGHTLTAKEVTIMDKEASAKLKTVPGDNLLASKPALEYLAERYHPSYHLLLHLQLTLLNTYARQDLKGISGDELHSLLSVSKQLLSVIRAIQPPYSRLRARVARQLIRCEMEQMRRQQHQMGDDEAREKLKSLFCQLEECQVCLDWDNRMPSMKDVQELYTQLASKCST